MSCVAGGSVSYTDLVASFDSSDNRHYDGTFHASNNKMHLPEATLQFRLQDDFDSRSLKIDSIFKGFELRLDRHVTRYMAETYVVYNKGKQQIEQLYRAYPIDAVQPKSAEGREDEKPPPRQPGKRLLLQCAAEFVSGKVLLVKGGQENLPSRRNTFASGYDTPEQQKSAALAESISLPGVSLWIDSIEGTEEDPGMCQISVVSRKVWSAELAEIGTCPDHPRKREYFQTFHLAVCRISYSPESNNVWHFGRSP